MKKLLNTLYVLTPESYLYHRNENICVKVGGEEKVSIPALTLENIVCFGVNTVSTPLIGFCGEKSIALTFLSGNGRFLGRVTGPVSGNVLLRTAQYASTGRRDFVDALVRDLLYAKLRNSKEVLRRIVRMWIACAALKVRPHPNIFPALTACCERRHMALPWKGAAAVRPRTKSTPRFLLHTRFWLVKCALPWKVWAWIPRLDTCMRCGQGARPLRWT